MEADRRRKEADELAHKQREKELDKLTATSNNLRATERSDGDKASTGKEQREALPLPQYGLQEKYKSVGAFPLTFRHTNGCTMLRFTYRRAKRIAVPTTVFFLPPDLWVKILVRICSC